MCGILGFLTKERTEEQIKMLERLMLQSKIRGLHAFGYAYCKPDNSITSIKSYFLRDDFLEDFILHKESNMLIFHARYSTSGDWGNMTNNQPIVVDKRAIALNGVISMKTKEEFEKDFDVKCDTENDTEILLRTELTIEEFMLINEQASIAAVMIDNGCLKAFRNNKRPLYYFHHANAIYIVSTIDIARRAGYDGQIAVVEPFAEVVFHV